jgi:hypothetical protein
MRSALELAKRGMYVFPLRPMSKRPAVRRDWEGAATFDPDVIRRIWRAAAYNIGIATGPSQLLVVDLDDPRGGARPGRMPEGRRSLAALAEAAGAVVPQGTFTVSTPRGEHLYFRAPAGVELRNTVGRLGAFVDTRACGGYVVGPGSVIAQGRYRVVASADPAPAPAWIVDRLRRSETAIVARTAGAAGRRSSAYVQAAVRGEVERVAGAAVGQRNNALFRASARLGGFVAAGGLTAADARAALVGACGNHLGIEGFHLDEVDRTIESGLRRALGPVRGTDWGSGSRGALPERGA